MLNNPNLMACLTELVSVCIKCDPDNAFAVLSRYER